MPTSPTPIHVDAASIWAFLRKAVESYPIHPVACSGSGWKALVDFTRHLLALHIGPSIVPARRAGTKSGVLTAPIPRRGAMVVGGDTSLDHHLAEIVARSHAIWPIFMPIFTQLDECPGRFRHYPEMQRYAGIRRAPFWVCDMSGVSLAGSNEAGEPPPTLTP